MVGIYKYACGLQFTGIVAETEEDAKAYLRNKYGYTTKVMIGRDDKFNPIFADKFIPHYNEEAFEIKEVTFIKMNKEQ